MQTRGDALARGGELVVAANGFRGIVRLDLYTLALEVRDGIVRDGHHAVLAGARYQYFGYLRYFISYFLE